MEGRPVDQDPGQRSRPLRRVVPIQPAGQAHSVVEQGAHVLRELMGAPLPVDGGANGEDVVQADQFGQVPVRIFGGSRSKGVHLFAEGVKAAGQAPLGISRPMCGRRTRGRTRPVGGGPIPFGAGEGQQRAPERRLVGTPDVPLTGIGQPRQQGERFVPHEARPLTPSVGVEHPRVPDERVEMAEHRTAVVRGVGRFHADERLERGKRLGGSARVVESRYPVQQRPGDGPTAGPLGQDGRDQLGHDVGSLGVPALVGEPGGPLTQPFDRGNP